MRKIIIFCSLLTFFSCNVIIRKITPSLLKRNVSVPKYWHYQSYHLPQKTALNKELLLIENFSNKRFFLMPDSIACMDNLKYQFGKDESKLTLLPQFINKYYFDLYMPYDENYDPIFTVKHISDSSVVLSYYELSEDSLIKNQINLIGKLKKNGKFLIESNFSYTNEFGFNRSKSSSRISMSYLPEYGLFINFHKRNKYKKTFIEGLLGEETKIYTEECKCLFKEI